MNYEPGGAGSNPPWRAKFNHLGPASLALFVPSGPVFEHDAWNSRAGHASTPLQNEGTLIGCIKFDTIAFDG